MSNTPTLGSSGPARTGARPAFPAFGGLKAAELLRKGLFLGRPRGLGNRADEGGERVQSPRAAWGSAPRPEGLGRGLPLQTPGG